MMQEIKITLTLSVDIEKSKEDIKKYIYDMEQTYTSVASSRNRLDFSEILHIEVKEESEIYSSK